VQLKELRRRRRISVEDLAFLAGIHPSTYVRIERGESRPRNRTALALARALQTPPRKMGEVLLETWEAKHPAQEDEGHAARS
jgi:transcriptional regulator with XRE-family HTH domain